MVIWQVTTALQKALGGERNPCFDLELRSRVHGRAIQLQVSIEPKRDAEGQVVGAVCIGEDVAMRRRMLEVPKWDRTSPALLPPSVCSPAARAVDFRLI
jgi:hypothetical protein